jgi:hypothetical protein
VASLLKTTQELGKGLPTELRQSGYTRNEAQTVDAVFAQAAEQAAISLAEEAVTQKLSTVAPCAAGATGAAAEMCAKQFIASFAAKAFRRPLLQLESDALFSVYQVGAQATGYSSGISLVIRAVLQAPSFWYLTELGDDPRATRVTLTPHEIAAELASLFGGGLPDDALLAEAASGALLDPAKRVAQAQRMLALPGAKRQLQAMTLQWLGLDKLESISKDAVLFPNFSTLKPQLLDEASEFTTEVFFNRKGGLRMLLSADFSMASAEVAQLYGISGTKPISLQSTPRRGILSQGAFLAAYSNVADSGPIHRGTAIVRKLGCVPLPNPGELQIVITVPPASANLTTRERFDQHSTNPDCKGCHQLIDPAGFAFESYDTIGRYRTQENGKTIDTTAELRMGDMSGPVANSTELVEKLSKSLDVQRCFAKNMYRFATSQTNAAGETAFLAHVDGLDPSVRGDPLQLLLTFVGTDLFVTRSIQ